MMGSNKKPEVRSHCGRASIQGLCRKGSSIKRYDNRVRMTVVPMAVT